MTMTRYFISSLPLQSKYKIYANIPISFNNRSEPNPYYSSSSAMNGFAISSLPSSGETRDTCVPLTTTNPSFLF